MANSRQGMLQSISLPFSLLFSFFFWDILSESISKKPIVQVDVLLEALVM